MSLVAIPSDMNGTLINDATVFCVENCPQWKSDFKGNFIWSEINFDGMTPVEPFEDGEFNPLKPAIFRTKIRFTYKNYDAANYITINYYPTCRELSDYGSATNIMNSGISSIPPSNAIDGMVFSDLPIK